MKKDKFEDLVFTQHSEALLKKRWHKILKVDFVNNKVTLENGKEYSYKGIKDIRDKFFDDLNI